MGTISLIEREKSIFQLRPGHNRQIKYLQQNKYRHYQNVYMWPRQSDNTLSTAMYPTHNAQQEQIWLNLKTVEEDKIDMEENTEAS
jgi:hypothetical protein